MPSPSLISPGSMTQMAASGVERVTSHWDLTIDEDKDPVAAVRTQPG